MASKIITRRLLKNNRQLVVINNNAARSAGFNVQFRVYNRQSMATKSNSPRFLQEIQLSDGRIARVYARTEEEAEEIRKAIKDGKLVIDETAVKPAEKSALDGPNGPKKPEGPQNGPAPVTDGAHAVPEAEEGPKVVSAPAPKPESMGLTAILKMDEKNKAYLEGLQKDEKYYMLKEGEKPKSGFVAVEVPVEGTQSNVRYAVSMEEAEDFQKKVESGEIKAEVPTKEMTPEADGIVDPDGDPTNPKNPVKGPEGPKPGPAPTNPPLNAHAVPPKPEEGVVDKPTTNPATTPTDVKTVNPTPAPALPSKKPKHIFRAILQGALTVLAGAAITVLGASVLGLPVVGLAAGLLSMFGIGKKFHERNVQKDAKESKKPRETKLDRSLTEDLQAELAEAERLEKQKAVLLERQKNAQRRAEIEKLEGGEHEEGPELNK